MEHPKKNETRKHGTSGKNETRKREKNLFQLTILFYQFLVGDELGL
jgi:hypothetical protein